MTAYRFLEPLDVLFFRGNRLFGDPGSYSLSLVPPWPSVAAGGIRSQMLAADQVDLERFSAGTQVHPSLGTPEQPGSFRLTQFCLARRVPPVGHLDDQQVETLHPVPADLEVSRCQQTDQIVVTRLHPQQMDVAISTSGALTKLPVLRSDTRSKSILGYWMSSATWQNYLRGGTPDGESLVAAEELWRFDSRVGLGLGAESRSAEQGSLFSSVAVALQPGAGFLVGIEGAEPPADGLLRLGGDGRAVASRAIAYRSPDPDYSAIAEACRCRLVLTTPLLSSGGWRLPGMADDGSFRLHGITGKVVAAAVPRAEVVSGWDLALRRPKSANRVAPAGSVYWLESLKATAGDLQKLAHAGLWQTPQENPQRRAEGFNRFTFASS